MTAPPPYPRIPYLWPSGNDRDDLVLDAASRSRWLTDPVVVEEKLDGANVSLWLESGSVHVSSRGGAGAMDRAGQLGRLRAWAAEHDGALRPLLDTGLVVYGEWLWLTHGVRYDALPELLVVLDMWDPRAGFASTPERDTHAREAGLLVPPLLFGGCAPHLGPAVGPPRDVPVVIVTDGGSRAPPRTRGPGQGGAVRLPTSDRRRMESIPPVQRGPAQPLTTEHGRLPVTELRGPCDRSTAKDLRIRGRSSALLNVRRRAVANPSRRRQPGRRRRATDGSGAT